MSILYSMRPRNFLGGVAVGAAAMYLLRPDRSTTPLDDDRAGVQAPTRTGRYGLRLGDIAGLEAANLSTRSVRLSVKGLTRLAGGAMAVYGLLRRGKTGRVLRMAGLGLAARRVRPARPAGASAGERRRTVDIQQTMYVEAPVERVYAFGTTYENLPLFLSNVRQVRDLGGGRSLWIVGGRDGAHAAWTAIVTERKENRLLAWRSEAGAVLDNAGVIRFGPEGAGTRIDLRFCYSPPGERSGGAMSEFFGADPRARMSADLGRLRTMLESTVRSDSHG